MDEADLLGDRIAIISHVSFADYIYFLWHNWHICYCYSVVLYFILFFHHVVNYQDIFQVFQLKLLK